VSSSSPLIGYHLLCSVMLGPYLTELVNSALVLTNYLNFSHIIFFSYN
jgi:hypothetical protein